MSTTRPDTDARIRDLIAQGKTQQQAFSQAIRELTAWAHANGYATDKPNTQPRKAPR